MINHLTIRNIKGVEHAEYDLTQLTVVTGANARGKTTICDACDWLTVGYSPKLRSPDAKGVSNEKMFSLCSGSFMEASITTGKGVSSRRIEKNVSRKGDVSYAATATNELEFPKILRDFNLYQSLSIDARVKYVSSLVTLSDATGFSIPELLAAVLNVNLGDSNSETSEVAKQSAHTILRELPVAEPLDWIALALSKIVENLKAAKQTRQRMTATGLAITQLKQQDDEQQQCGGAAETKLLAARTALGKLQEAIGSSGFAVNEQKRKEQRRTDIMAVQRPGGDLDASKKAQDELQTRIMRGKRHIRERVTSTETLFGILTRLLSEREQVAKESQRHVALRIEFEKMPKPPNVEAQNQRMAELEPRHLLWQKSINERPKTTFQLMEELASSNAKRDAKAEEWKSLKQQIAHATEEIREFNVETEKFMGEQACCPTCAAAGQEWKTRWKAGRDKELAVMQRDRATLEVKFDNAAIAGTGFKTECGKLELALIRFSADDKAAAEVEREINDLKLRLQVGATSQAAYSTAQKSIAECLDEERKLTDLAAELERRIAIAQTDYNTTKNQDDALSQLEQDHAAAQVKLDALTESFKEWTAAQAELATLADTDLVSAQATHTTNQDAVEKKKHEIRGFEEQKKSVDLARGDLKRQIDAEKAAAAAQSQCDVLKAVKELLESKQASLVETAFKSLLEIVNRFTSVLLPPLEYRSGEIGYHKDGCWCSSATFSGAEELLTFVGLCVSLASRAEQKVVIIDEMSRLDDGVKSAFLNRLLELIKSGVIHQAIVCDVDCDAYLKINDPLASVIRV